MPLLALPTQQDTEQITKAFLSDLESLTVTDDKTKKIKTIIQKVEKKSAKKKKQITDLKQQWEHRELSRAFDCRW